MTESIMFLGRALKVYRIRGTVTMDTDCRGKFLDATDPEIQVRGKWHSITNENIATDARRELCRAQDERQ